MSTGFLYDPRFLEHEPGAGHPERKERLSTSIAYLRDRSWLSDLHQLDAAAADRRWIRTIHSASRKVMRAKAGLG